MDLRSFTSRWVLEWLATDPASRHRRLDTAALVFLDISGFTAMSERLATLGRVGAEEVREVVDRTFTDLLHHAYREGASLLKFGGDALLLLFEGEGATTAAVRSAWDLRATLHAANPVETAAGGIELDVTMGVHSGPVDLFLVGSSHRELIVAGPTASRVIEVEGAADRGEILVSSEVASLLGAGLTTSGPDGRHVLVATPLGEGLPAAPDRPQDGEVGGEFLSAPVARRAAEGKSGEHRHATIGFIHFSGTDDVLASEGAEALALALDQLVSTVQDACDATDVCFLASDIDADGGKLILTAGVPTAADDDDDRIVNAARRIIEANTRLPVQIGLNRGPVFAGVVGPPYRLTYTVLGDAVNLAARIMSRADHREVLAESEVMNRCRTLYDATPLEPFAVKGKQAPVRAVRVGRELGVRVRIRTDEAGFVGREPEITWLTALADRTAASGQGHAVALTGPAGIGKSRLVDELQELRPSLPFHLVACSRFGAERPYRAAAMLLRLVLTQARHGAPKDPMVAAAALARGNPEIEPWLPLLGDVYEVDVVMTDEARDLAPGFRAEQTRLVMARLLAAALPGPACLVIEDAAWLDPESRQLFAELAETMLEHRPWILLCTARGELDLGGGVQHMPIPPLTDEESRALLLSAVDRGEVALDLVEAIRERGEGNPLFLRELTRTAHAGELPDSLESLFQNRLDQLPAASRHLLSHAAVLGVEFPPKLLEELAATSTDTTFEELTNLGEFLTPMRSGYLRFNQSLHQEVAYSSLPYRLRRRLHQGAARALESVQQQGGQVAIEALSRHHHLAGEYEKSWRSSRQAFAVARARSAVESAAVFARRALEAGGRIGAPDRAITRIWEELGDVLELAGAYPDAEDAYRRARKQAAATDQPRLCRNIGHVHERTGRYTQALRWYTIGARHARALPDGSGLSEVGPIEVRRAVTLMRQGRRREAMRLAESRLAATDLPQRDRAEAMWILGWALTERQDTQGGRVLGEAADLFAKVGDLGKRAIALNAMGGDAYFRGDWTVAAQLYEQARDAWQRAGDRGNQAVANVNIAELLGDQGEFTRARTAALEAYQFGRAARHQVLRLFALLVRGRLEARLGHVAEATTCLDEAEELANELGAPSMVAAAHLRRSELAWFVGDLDAALTADDRANNVPGNEPEPGTECWSLRVRGCVTAATDPAAGTSLLAQAAAVAADASLPYDEWLARAAMTTLGLVHDDVWVAEQATRLGIVCPPEVLVRGTDQPRP